jgi:hypothetical protein
MSHLHFEAVRRQQGIYIGDAECLVCYSSSGADRKNINDIEYSIDPNIKKISISNLILHKLANEHPEMTEVEFERLKESISEIGQLEPILIYRGKIVDGRHRFWAFESLGLNEILVKEIPANTPLDTVKEIVFGSEVRRHQTATQKAIKAWWATQEDGITYREAEVKFMTSRTMISACRYISDIRSNDLLKGSFYQSRQGLGQ